MMNDTAHLESVNSHHQGLIRLGIVFLYQV